MHNLLDILTKFLGACVRAGSCREKILGARKVQPAVGYKPLSYHLWPPL
jgi:hypothetical protein